MENCLVTKLKGVVDNDNLPVLGTLRFKVLNNDELYFQNVEKVSIIGGGHFCSDSSYSDNIGKMLVPETGTNYIRAYVALDTAGVPCDILIKDSYGLQKLSSTVVGRPILTGDFSQLNYRTPVNIRLTTDKDAYGNLDSMDVSQLGAQEGMSYGITIENTSSARNNIEFNIEKLAEISNASFKVVNLAKSKAYGNIFSISSRNLLYIDLNQTDVVGTINSFENNTNITWLSLYSCPSIYGNIESLYKLINTTRILLSGTAVTGTIETLAEGMLAQGKTTEVQITVQYGTFNNIPLNGGRVSLNFGSGTITVRQNTSTGSILGTYSNGTWTYNS